MPRITNITPLENGIDEDKARELWGKLEKFAQYSFNKSHSVEYALISVQTMYLKTHYPAEFYAAAMTMLDEDKRHGLIQDARNSGITLAPPDVNISTNRFEAADDTTIVAPLNVVAGIAAKGAEKIMAERARGGPFESVEDFEARIDGRSVNRSVRAKLDEIGAFASIQPGALPATDMSRHEAQAKHCASIMIDGAPVTRALVRTRESVEAVKDLVLEMQKDAAFGDMKPVAPRFGGRARFMAIFDGPQWSEVEAGRMTDGRSFGYCAEALDAAGLEIRDGYWTALCKTGKAEEAEGKRFLPAHVRASRPYLDREIELLKPQALVLMGTQAMKAFCPNLKGGILDHAGKVIYDKKTERNLLVGMNPGMCAFEESRKETLAEVFERLAGMLRL